MEIQIMKIYDMVEGKWLKDKEKNKEKQIEDYEDFGLRTRLITYDEEKDWVVRERDYVKMKKQRQLPGVSD